MPIPYDIKNQNLNNFSEKSKIKIISSKGNEKHLGGNKKMVKIDKSEYAFSETLKASDVKEDKKVEIIEVKPVGTRYGDKRIAILNDGTQIFLNALSLQNLAEGISDETDDWVNKELTLSTETSERTRGKASIVLLVNEEQRIKTKKK